MSAQIIDDQEGKTLVSVSAKDIKNLSSGKGESQRVALAKALGKEIAARAEKKKIKEVVFDRGPYAYHGRVKAFAESARAGGLKF